RPPARAALPGTSSALPWWVLRAGRTIPRSDPPASSQAIDVGSVEPGVARLLGDRLVEGRVDDDGLLGDLLAGVHLLDEVDDLVAEHRVALDDVVELAVLERLQTVAHGVDRDDEDVLARLLASGLDGLDRTETHV